MRNVKCRPSQGTFQRVCLFPYFVIASLISLTEPPLVLGHLSAVTSYPCHFYLYLTLWFKRLPSSYNCISLGWTWGQVATGLKGLTDPQTLQATTVSRVEQDLRLLEPPRLQSGRGYLGAPATWRGGRREPAHW